MNWWGPLRHWYFINPNMHQMLYSSNTRTFAINPILCLFLWLLTRICAASVFIASHNDIWYYKMRFRFRRSLRMLGLWFITVQAYYLIKWPLMIWMDDGIFSAFTREIHKYSQRTHSLRRELDSIVSRLIKNRAANSNKGHYKIETKGNNSSTLARNQNITDRLANKEGNLQSRSANSYKNKSIEGQKHPERSAGVVEAQKQPKNQLPLRHRPVKLSKGPDLESQLTVMHPTNATKLRDAYVEDIIFAVRCGWEFQCNIVF